MTANEIVKAKRAFVDLRYAAENCDRTNTGCQWRKYLLDAAALLESMQAQIAEYETTGLTPGDVKDLQGLCKENGLAEYVDLIVQAKRQMGKDNERSIEQDERIEQLESKLKASKRMAQDARNELCLKCGRYREAHNGACDGCRWKE